MGQIFRSAMHINFDAFAYRYPDSHLVAGRLEEPFAAAPIGARGGTYGE
jgi:hypothetical protein